MDSPAALVAMPAATSKRQNCPGMGALSVQLFGADANNAAGEDLSLAAPDSVGAVSPHPVMGNAAMVRTSMSGGDRVIQPPYADEPDEIDIALEPWPGWS